MTISLLCAGIKPIPGSTKYDELAGKMDTIANDMKTLNKATMDR